MLYSVSTNRIDPYRSMMRTLYGPIDSWRLGRSLGVDPLAKRHKVCPFSCSYCQYGATPRPTLHRQDYVTPAQLGADLDALGVVSCDCVTFAGLGEPTLAANLPELVEVVRARVGWPIVLLTGTALLPLPGVRRDLCAFDHVVATLNAADESTFQQINRPAPGYPYSLEAVLDGLRRFRDIYPGRLVVQIMLIQANRAAALRLADLTRSLDPDEVQLNTPLQPALGGPLSAAEMEAAAQAFAGLPVRCLYDTDCTPPSRPF